MDAEQKKMLKEALMLIDAAKGVISNMASELEGELEELDEKTPQGEKLNDEIGELEEMDNALDDLIGDLGDLINK